jgi:NADPH-dependent 2,4-dienoyl-CoA reductase/sulfur reductase-like enzyme
MSEPQLQFEVVIVGAGPAGMSAAWAAAQSGRSVALIDGMPWLGGQIWRGEQVAPRLMQARKWIERVRQSGVTLLDNTTVVAAPEKNILLAEHRDGPRKIKWEKLILATGARELFLPFPGWELPGVLGPGGLLALAKNGWPIAGKKVVVAGTGPLLLAAADGLKKHGAVIVSVAEQASSSRVFGFGLKLLRHPGKIIQGLGIKVRLAGSPYRCGVWPVKAHGREHVESVELTDGKKSWTEECDLLAAGFHLVPNLELPMLLECALADGFVKVDEWQASNVKNVYCAGEPTGIGGADGALIEGQVAGYASSGQAERARELFGQRQSMHAFRASLATAFELRPELKKIAGEDTIFCRCEDVTFGRVKPYTNWREAKLLTRCGMGACQGRICGAAAKVMLGWGAESTRPPVLPTRIETLLFRN